ncbi:hypothetical protein KDA23_01850 [Candidatus Saccharibacteria bacterium]|nr:hypothetical protein [Candidatus Saccharibacteria bacterium]
MPVFDLLAHPAALLLTICAGLAVLVHLFVIIALWRQPKLPRLPRHKVMLTVVASMNSTPVATRDNLLSLINTSSRPEKLEIVMTYQASGQAKQARALRHWYASQNLAPKLRLVSRNRGFQLHQALSRYSVGRLVVITSEPVHLQRGFDDLLRRAFANKALQATSLQPKLSPDNSLIGIGRILLGTTANNNTVTAMRRRQLHSQHTPDQIIPVAYSSLEQTGNISITRRALAVLVTGITLSVCLLDPDYALLCLAGLTMLIFSISPLKLSTQPFVRTSDKVAIWLFSPFTLLLTPRLVLAR